MAPTLRARGKAKPADGKKEAPPVKKPKKSAPKKPKAVVKKQEEEKNPKTVPDVGDEETKDEEVSESNDADPTTSDDVNGEDSGAEAKAESNEIEEEAAYGNASIVVEHCLLSREDLADKRNPKRPASSPNNGKTHSILGEKTAPPVYDPKVLPPAPPALPRAHEISNEPPSSSQQQTYKRKADQLIAVLGEEFPEIEVEVNPIKPRSKSFELTLWKPDCTEVLLWSGIKKGPPRKLKFPEAGVIIDAIKKNL